MLGCLLAILLLSGCASTPRRPPCANSPRWRPSCRAYHELTERYRHTYQREQPFLTPAADARERQLTASASKPATISSSCRVACKPICRRWASWPATAVRSGRSGQGHRQRHPRLARPGLDDRHVSALPA
jgi:hypothetical protein